MLLFSTDYTYTDNLTVIYSDYKTCFVDRDPNYENGKESSNIIKQMPVTTIDGRWYEYCALCIAEAVYLLRYAQL